MSNNKKPVSKVSIYPITAAIWRNHGHIGAGFYTATFERSYQEGDAWKTTNSFTVNDLLVLAKVADQAHSEIHKLLASDRQRHKTGK
jgi:hypothetical protein